MPCRSAAMRWRAREIRGESLERSPRRRLSRRRFLALSGATVAGGLLGYA
ncbi:MAG: twin-arginine translocation signal domain-containing protein, partial [Myxococcota bacterium]